MTEPQHNDSFSLEIDRALDPSVYGPVIRVRNALSVYEMANMRAYIAYEEAQNYAEDRENRPVTRSKELYADYGFSTNLARYCLDQYRGLVLTMEEEMVEPNKWIDPKIEEEPLVVHETMRCSTPGVEYKSHKDLASKKLTGLIYLSPRKGNGTRFHGKDNNLSTRDTWEVNTGYIFKPNQFSFHSYHNEQLQNRYVYMFNLYVHSGNFNARQNLARSRSNGGEPLMISKEMKVTESFDIMENSVDKIIPI